MPNPCIISIFMLWVADKCLGLLAKTDRQTTASVLLFCSLLNRYNIIYSIKKYLKTMLKRMTISIKVSVAILKVIQTKFKYLVLEV